MLTTIIYRSHLRYVWGGDRFCTVKNLEEDAGKADE